jgi:hypothetical protein
MSAEADGGLVVGRSGRSAWVARLVLLAVSAAVTVLVVRVVGRVDWSAVRDALSQLTWWQPLVLLVALLARQVLNALPLALYLPGVSVVHATVNDLAAILTSMIAPPPSDVALRLAMFSSWGVPPRRGLAGVFMNTLTFYIVRFSAPLLGFVLLLVVGRAPGARWLELLSIAVAAVILTGVLLVVRSERLARTVGTRAGSAARRVRRSVDPAAWSQACVAFRDEMAAQFRRAFPRSLLGLSAMLAVDLVLLLLCLRFVGVSRAEVGGWDIAIAYLFAYPFTIFPFSGIGVVDALILAALVEAGGSAVEPAAVAALIVWRVFTVAGPVLMGVGALAWWRRGPRRTDPPVPGSGDPNGSGARPSPRTRWERRG